MYLIPCFRRVACIVRTQPAEPLWTDQLDNLLGNQHPSHEMYEATYRTQALIVVVSGV